MSAATEVRASARASLEAECAARLDALVAEGTLRGWFEGGDRICVVYRNGGEDLIDRRTADGTHDHGFGWLEDFAPKDFAPAVDYSDLPGCVREWLDGLAHVPKREWAAGYCRAVLTGAPEPEVTPGHFTEKAKRRADRLFFSGEGDMTGFLRP